MTVPRPAKKIAPPLPNWRTTLWHAHAIYQHIAARRMSYGEFMRQATSHFLTGDRFHDFDSSPAVVGPSDSVFGDSQFDAGDRV